MTMLLCPVCGGNLERVENTWRCAAGHSFDVARQGYVNLLTVSQKHSKNPGDTKEMVAARKEFLNRGHYAPIARTLCEVLRERVPENAAILDAGCGEGYYLTSVGEALPQAALYGVDISKDAVRYAAVRNKNALWITGTAAHLPFADGSFDALLSMFAMTAPAEFARVLKPSGVFVQVLAGRDHLLGLKRLIYPELTEKAPTAPADYDGFRLLEDRTLEFDFTLTDNAQIMQLLSMTPHFWRISREGAARAAAADTLSDRAQVLFHVYERL
jgi:23S rRNA (guanine745-N1)-methyltransferase